MSLTLGIRLLGGFALTTGNRLVAEITSGRCQALLAYLVLHRQAPQSRQRIAFHLWSESTDNQARANLRKELSRLRHCLPNLDEFLQVEAKTLQWLPLGNFTLDVAEFEAAAKRAEQLSDRGAIQAQLEQALELYRGDLLPDLDDEWVLAERERLRQIYMRSLERLMIVLEAQQDYPSALTYAQQLLRVDDLNEATYAALMRLHGLHGDRAKALQVYHQCMTVLREALGIDPSASTRKLYERLLREEDACDRQLPHDTDKRQSPQPFPRPMPLSAHAHLGLPALIGREQEWAIIQQWLSRNHQNSSKTVSHRVSDVLLLVGEPGIGKTRLLEELQVFAQANHTQVLWGRGFAAEMMRPYGIWIDILRSTEIPSTSRLPLELGFLLPELGQPSQAPPDLSHLFDAVVQQLRQWAKQAPLLVLLDDIQWIDEASSALIHYAIRLLRPFPVLFAFAARTQELADHSAIARVVQALRREQQLQTLELRPLDREQTADLIRSTRVLAPSALSLALVNQVFIDSGGNPLFTLEIARTVGQHQPAQVNTLEALIRDRLQLLDDTTREFLPWAAALGRSFKPSTVAHVADYSVTQVLTAIEQLEQQAMIRPGTVLEHEIGYDFAHDIVRQVIYQQLSQPRRQLIHLQIAQKLNQQTLPDNSFASMIARHASLGGDHALATSAALAAAERCLKLFAYAEALELAQQGIQHCQFLDSPQRVLSHAKLLRVCALSGVTGDRTKHIENASQQLIQEAQGLGLNEAEIMALEALIILQFDRSDFTAVHRQTLRAIEVSRMTSPAMTARVLAASGSCLAEIGRDLIRAEALLLEAQSLADRVGMELCDIFSGLGCVHRHHGRYKEANAHLQRAWRLVQAQQDHWRAFTYLSYLAMTALEAGNPAAALPYCDQMLEVADNIHGEGSETAVARALTALVHYQLGQPNAGSRLTEAIAALQQVDAKRMLAYLLLGAAAVDLSQSQAALAVERAAAALQNAQIVNHPSEIALSWALLIQGLTQLGEHQRARNEVEQLQIAIAHIDLSQAAQTAVEHVMQQLQTQMPSTKI